ncbi:MAG: hypothetical protein GY765_25725 [bacterium]|nr:hypothetical protein [bacterium]
MLESLAKASDEKIVPPFKLLARTRSMKKDGEPLTDIDSSRDPLKVFENLGALSQLTFTRHFKTQITASRKEEILMRHSDGSAAFAVSDTGRGTAVYMNFPVSPNSGNLAGSPLFPALMHECLDLGGKNTADKARPGMALEIRIPGGDEKQEVLGPDGQGLEYSRVSLGNQAKLTIPGTNLPGIYPVYLDKKRISFGVVNIDPVECDTRRFPVRELESGDPDSPLVAYSADKLKMETRKDLWPNLWVLVALFTGLEMLVLAIWRKNN